MSTNRTELLRKAHVLAEAADIIREEWNVPAERPSGAVNLGGAITHVIVSAIEDASDDLLERADGEDQPG